MTRRTALFALAAIVTAWWPALAGAQASPHPKTASVQVYQAPG